MPSLWQRWGIRQRLRRGLGFHWWQAAAAAVVLVVRESGMDWRDVGRMASAMSFSSSETDSFEALFGRGGSQ